MLYCRHHTDSVRGRRLHCLWQTHASIAAIRPFAEVEPFLEFFRAYSSVTRKERFNNSLPPQCIDDIVVDRKCSLVCQTCLKDIADERMPKNSFANGLWVGDVPEVLTNLTWAERQLVAKVRINSYVVQVSSSRVKMMGNVVSFANPMVKVYHALPPPLHEVDQMLAILWLGLSRPTPDELNRTPLLVRRNAIAAAL